MMMIDRQIDRYVALHNMEKSILITYKNGGLNDIKATDPVIEGHIRGLIAKTVYWQIKRSKRKQAIVGKPLGKLVVLKKVSRNRIQKKKQKKIIPNPVGQSVWDLTSSTLLIFIAGNYKKTLLGEA